MFSSAIRAIQIILTSNYVHLHINWEVNNIIAN
jgi:hypothetical protein